MSHPISQTLSSGAGGCLRIDLPALADNYARLKQQAPNAVAGAVVKANAYGLGVIPVTQTLYAAGCRDFFVALAREAFELRPHLPTDAKLYILNGLPAGAEGPCAAQDIIPVLNSTEQITRWAEQARIEGRTLPCALQVDTGMSRLGLSPDELDAFLANPPKGFDIRLLMSHLACADEPDNPANSYQLKAMQRAMDRFPNVPVSFANSGGIFLNPAYHHDLIRPGIALYGGAPHDGKPNPMKPVIRLDIAVTQTRTVPAGAHIGYGGTFVSDREMRLATLSAGYADGLPRALSNRGAAWFDGVRLPIVGRVSMDSIIIDISALKPDAVQAGSFVELIGPHQSVDDLARDAETISYEILTQLGSRYHRHYIPVKP
ncbi:alanine racemase [Asticcacaulis machinosus]|uniref:Alanine racemase n=1 Tax=Asticcacaulis machinosus TaxID=2984211 RepID=A0ABT5HJI3_9CAUL|nr:alanine racemase [Asticcacaulis machinosus]MDC7676397.1 alanine racemase [Asticcacaulis machinosus]